MRGKNVDRNKDGVAGMVWNSLSQAGLRFGSSLIFILITSL